MFWPSDSVPDHEPVVDMCICIRVCVCGMRTENYELLTDRNRNWNRNGVRVL